MAQETTYPVGAAAGVPAATDVQPAARRISLGAVFAGVVLALAVNVLLNLLGIGIGLATVDPTEPGGTPSGGSLSVGAALWWTACFLISLLVGSFAAARLSGVRLGSDGVLHGLVTWAVAFLLTMWLLTSAIGAVIGGAFTALGTGTSTLAQAVPPIGQLSNMLPSGGQITPMVDQLLGRVAPNADQNQIAEARQQLTQLVPDLIAGGQRGEEARNRATEIISRLSGTSPEEARQQLNQWYQQSETAVRQAADDAAQTFSSAALWSCLAIALGALVSALGGYAGKRSDWESAPDRGY